MKSEKTKNNRDKFKYEGKIRILLCSNLPESDLYFKPQADLDKPDVTIWN
jgi:hypothetical protein